MLRYIACKDFAVILLIKHAGIYRDNISGKHYHINLCKIVTIFFHNCNSITTNKKDTHSTDLKKNYSALFCRIFSLMTSKWVQLITTIFHNYNSITTNTKDTHTYDFFKKITRHCFVGFFSSMTNKWVQLKHIDTIVTHMSIPSRQYTLHIMQ